MKGRFGFVYTCWNRLAAAAAKRLLEAKFRVSVAPTEQVSTQAEIFLNTASTHVCFFSSTRLFRNMEKQPHTIADLSPRESALDAYYRLAWAFDYNDWDLFKSGFASKSEVSFHMEDGGVHCHSLAEIRTRLFDIVCGLDTQHIATNARIDLNLDSKTGRMWIMALNQHFRKGEEAKAGAPRLWGGNRYMFNMVEEDGSWKIKDWFVEMGWNEGDLSIVGR